MGLSPIERLGSKYEVLLYDTYVRKGKGKAKGRKEWGGKRKKKKKRKETCRRGQSFYEMRRSSHPCQKNAIRKINADLYCYVSSNLVILFFLGVLFLCSLVKTFLFPYL